MPQSWKGRLDTGFRFALGALFLLIAVIGLRGYRPDEAAVELSFPLLGGTYIVGQGGASLVINAHNPHPAQRFALDIVKLNRFGTRARGLYPRALERYAIFGDTVVSPCSGRVAAMRDSLPDLAPPRSDPEQPAGNYVALECGGTTVVLAHLMRGSVQVRTGEQVFTSAAAGPDREFGQYHRARTCTFTRCAVPTQASARYCRVCRCASTEGSWYEIVWSAPASDFP